MGKALFVAMVFIWMTVTGAGSAYESPKGKGVPSGDEKSDFEKYIAEEKKEETIPVKEEAENALLAPVAKPVVEVMKGVGGAVEPLLEERTLAEDEKGEPTIKMVPKEGKVMKHEF